jgi:hypothetical protein
MGLNFLIKSFPKTRKQKRFILLIIFAKKTKSNIGPLNLNTLGLMA